PRLRAERRLTTGSGRPGRRVAALRAGLGVRRGAVPTSLRRHTGLGVTTRLLGRLTRHRLAGWRRLLTRLRVSRGRAVPGLRVPRLLRLLLTRLLRRRAVPRLAGEATGRRALGRLLSPLLRVVASVRRAHRPASATFDSSTRRARSTHNPA